MSSILFLLILFVGLTLIVVRSLREYHVDEITPTKTTIKRSIKKDEGKKSPKKNAQQQKTGKYYDLHEFNQTLPQPKLPLWLFPSLPPSLHHLNIPIPYDVMVVLT